MKSANEMEVVAGINGQDEGDNSDTTSSHDPITPVGEGETEVAKKSIPPRPSSPEEEKTILKELESKANLDGFKEGDTWFLLSTRWWKKWKEFTSYDFPSYSAPVDPGPIDNYPIIEGEGEGDAPRRIKKSCMESYDFVILSEDMWDTIQSWYSGGPALPRKVIRSGFHSTNLVVEIRPLSLKICKSSASGEYITEHFSKSDTVGFFKERMCRIFKLNPDDVRVWDYHAHNRYKLLEDMEQKLESAQIIDGQPMLIEEKDEDGTFPEAPKSRTSYSNYSNYSSGPVDPGTTGLSNLGNTCFMNSSLQCLSNTAPLTEYFLSNQYKREINRDNPLGMKGEIAEAYASLIKDLWDGSHSSTAPRDFKWKLERFAPQFAGYQQHDSQELLAFLLDGLHEDLNRILTKPYTENPEVDDRPQEEVAREAWSAHKARNDSIIVDWFQGQLRSTLVCPVCDKVSITFDPFMYLSLPLPMKTTRTVSVTMFFLDPSRKPRKYACEVDKFGSVKGLQKELEKLSGVAWDSIAITDVYNSRFFKQFSSEEGIDGIQDRDIICGYEIVPAKDEDDEISYFPVIHRKVEANGSRYSYSYSRKTLFGTPFVLSARNASEMTYKDLYDMVYEQIRRYLNVPKDKIIRTTAELHGEAMEDDEEEEEKEEKEKEEKEEEDEPPNASADSSDEDEKPKMKKRKKNQPLFTLFAADSYGTSDGDILEDDDSPLHLKDRQNIAIEWDEEVAHEVFNETLAKEIELDPSCKKEPEKELEDSVTLKRCLELFTTKEQLGPEDPWYCSRCKEFQQATKKFDLWSLPPILVVHLKRFSYKNRYWREKLETLVDFPLQELNLSDYIEGPKTSDYTYDLYAVSVSLEMSFSYEQNHYGSLGGGHYTAYGKNKNNNKWYKFDDSSVSPVDDSRVKTSSAYVLFYRRRDTINSNPVAAPSNSKAEVDEDATQEMDSIDIQSSGDDQMDI